mgnify:CR=1 FL=1
MSAVVDAGLSRLGAALVHLGDGGRRVASSAIWPSGSCGVITGLVLPGGSGDVGSHGIEVASIASRRPPVDVFLFAERRRPTRLTAEVSAGRSSGLVSWS